MTKQSLAMPSAHDVRRIAVKAELHPNTIRRAYGGLPVRWLTVTRIARAARALGLPEPKNPAIAERRKDDVEVPDVH